MEKLITAEQIHTLAKELGYNPHTAEAVTRIEAPKGGFLPDGRVTILFERHQFYKRCKQLTSEQQRNNLDIWNQKAGGYLGPVGEWGRLERAKKLDETAALQSASWGKGQIMGFNHKLIGYHSVQEMVADFSTGEYAQVKGMFRFFGENRDLHRKMSLVSPLLKDFTTIAEVYNGKKQAEHEYDIRLQQAYIQLTKS